MWNLETLSQEVKPGYIIKSGENKLEVVSFDDNILKVKVLETSPHLGSYLNLGEEYTFDEHTPSSYLRLFEIPEEQMKSNSSQVLLYWWDDTGPSIEIDF